MLIAMIRYIDEHRTLVRGRADLPDPGGRPVELLRGQVPAALGTVGPRRRALADVIGRSTREHFGVYGVRKVWRALRREGIEAGRDQVGPADAPARPRRVRRERRDPHDPARAGRPAPGRPRRADLRAPAPNRLWVADLTYVWTCAGFCYAAFIVDVFSRADRRLAGRPDTAGRPRPRRPRDGDLRPGSPASDLVHHCDRGVQYLSIRYTERLAEAEAVSSVGIRGDSYDNALAETVNGLYKAELVHRRGPWRPSDEVELATADWVHSGTPSGSTRPAATSHPPSSRPPTISVRATSEAA